MATLVSEPVSIKLFEQVLYPISFICTPFMLGQDKMKLANKLTELSITKYYEATKLLFRSFCYRGTNLCDFEQCNWLYYGLRSEGNNKMIDFIHYGIQELSNEKKTVNRKSKVSLTSTATSTAVASAQQSDNEDADQDIMKEVDEEDKNDDDDEDINDDEDKKEEEDINEEEQTLTKHKTHKQNI